MVLAQLRAGTDILDRRSVTCAGQSGGQYLRTGHRVSGGNHVGTLAIHQVDHSTLSERADRLLAVAL